MGDQSHTPAALPPGKTRYPLYRMEAETGCEMLIYIKNKRRIKKHTAEDTVLRFKFVGRLQSNMYGRWSFLLSRFCCGLYIIFKKLLYGFRG